MGHRIIEINGQSVVAVPHERIVNLLATSVGEVIQFTTINIVNVDSKKPKRFLQILLQILKKNLLHSLTTTLSLTSVILDNSELMKNQRILICC